MIKEPLVSIIVPVYNASEYLRQCLTSLQNQTWRHIEVWLVNDGSRDDSLKICRKMAAKDSRFHVINQINKGVSAARNAALKQATGTYLQFVDGDDYLPTAATETLVKMAKATGADLTIAHFYRVIGDQQVRQGHIEEQMVFTRWGFAEKMMEAPANYYYGALWNKLYRRSLVSTSDLRFDTELQWCEDFLFNLEYIRYARLIATVPEPVYYYVKRANSLVSKCSNLTDTIRIKYFTFAYYKELYQELDLFDNQKAKVYKYLLSRALDGSCKSKANLPSLPSLSPLPPLSSKSPALKNGKKKDRDNNKMRVNKMRRA